METIGTKLGNQMNDKKTGVRVNIRVNHNRKENRSKMLSWIGDVNESNGKWIPAWIKIEKDNPVEIPIAGVTVSAEFKDQEPDCIKGLKGEQWRNKFCITVRRGIRTETFDFTGSINDAGNGIVNLTDGDKIFAFYCFIGDAIYGSEAFEDFQSNYGYDCPEGYRIWKLCKESTLKAVRLGLGDLYDLSNKLQETYPDVM